MALFVKVARATNLGKARAHVKYIAFRSRELPEDERGAFDRRTDHADVARFNEKLEDYMTRHPMATKAYKMTVSLSEKEFRERGLTSWKPIVREVMGNLEQKWGREFSWIASEHMAKGHPHVHIAIKATCVDGTGRYRQLRLEKGDLQDIKKEFSRVLDRYRPREREQERDKSLSRGDTFLRAFETALRALGGAARVDQSRPQPATPVALQAPALTDPPGPWSCTCKGARVEPGALAPKRQDPSCIKRDGAPAPTAEPAHTR